MTGGDRQCVLVEVVLNLSGLKTEIGNEVLLVSCNVFSVWAIDEHTESLRMSI